MPKLFNAQIIICVMVIFSWSLLSPSYHLLYFLLQFIFFFPWTFFWEIHKIFCRKEILAWKCLLVVESKKFTLKQKNGKRENELEDKLYRPQEIDRWERLSCPISGWFFLIFICSYNFIEFLLIIYLCVYIYIKYS